MTLCVVASRASNAMTPEASCVIGFPSDAGRNVTALRFITAPPLSVWQLARKVNGSALER